MIGIPVRAKSPKVKCIPAAEARSATIKFATLPTSKEVGRHCLSLKSVSAGAKIPH